MPKGISIHNMARDEQVYTFKYDDTGEIHHFAVNQMATYIRGRGLKPEMIAFDTNLVKHLVNRGGFEQAHLESLPEEALEAACILAEMPDGSHVLVDGVHRALRRAMRGDDGFEAYVVHKPVWERFLIFDIPEDIVDWDDFMRNGDRIAGPTVVGKLTDGDN